MTPNELNIHIEEFYKAKEEDQKFEKMMTYLGSKLPLYKKFPTFEEAFGVKIEMEKKEQSAEEMLEKVKRLNAALGGAIF